MVFAAFFVVKFWREILEDARGGGSSIRLNAVLANLAAIGIFGVVTVTNCYSAARTRSVAEVPEGLAIYAAAIVGMKVYQRSIEEKGSE